MKKTFVIYFILLCSIRTYAQKERNDSLADFDYTHFNEHLSEIKDKTSRENYLQSVQRNFIKRKYNLITEKTFESSSVATSTCGNLDFEDGNTAGWTMSGDFQVVSGTGSDPFGGFPVVCPGGNYSLKLNNSNTACSGPTPKTNFNASASRYIMLTPSNYIFKVNFSGVTLDFPHPASAAANIRIQFYDQFNNLIPSSNYSVCYSSPPNTIVTTGPTTFSNSSVLGPQICTTIGSYPVSYFPWQTKNFNLSPYIGQMIQIKLSADWCLYSYDLAYAYFDVCCDASCPVLLGSNSSTQIHNTCIASSFSTTICNPDTNTTNLQWSNSTGPISTASCITASSFDSYTLTSNPTSFPTFTINEVYNFGTYPTVTFTLPSTICISSLPVPLSAFPPGGTFSGTGVSGTTFTPSVLGVDSITYVYSEPIAGCKSSVTKTFQVTICKATGIEQKFKDFELMIAPNPFSSQLTIKCSELPENSEFILFNTLGQEILRKQLTDGKNSIETSTLPPGLYIYSLFSQNKQVKQGKLVKE